MAPPGGCAGAATTPARRPASVLRRRPAAARRARWRPSAAGARRPRLRARRRCRRRRSRRRPLGRRCLVAAPPAAAWPEMPMRQALDLHAPCKPRKREGGRAELAAAVPRYPPATLRDLGRDTLARAPPRPCWRNRPADHEAQDALRHQRRWSRRGRGRLVQGNQTHHCRRLPRGLEGR